MKHILLFLGILISNGLSNIHAQSGNIEPGKQIQLPYDRMIQPAGKLIIMGDSTKENHALDCALSPDKKWLAVEERYSIVFINTMKNEVEHVFHLDSIDRLQKAMNTYSGICWYKKNNVDYVFFSTS